MKCTYISKLIAELIIHILVAHIVQWAHDAWRTKDMIVRTTQTNLLGYKFGEDVLSIKTQQFEITSEGLD